MPMLLAMRAITGAAPVPVPPPMPAVMNTMCAPSSISRTRPSASSAAALPLSGLPPAPRPVSPSWISERAVERLSAWASVLAQMNSTFCTPLRIMWSTALPPPPPTPITLIKVPCANSSIISMGMCLSYVAVAVCVKPMRLRISWNRGFARTPSKVADDPVLGATEHRLHRTCLCCRLVPACTREARLLQQAHHGGRPWVGHHVVERARIAGYAFANGLQENVLAELDHARHHRGAAGDHDARGQQLLVARLANHLVHQRKDLLDARLDHAGQRLPAQHARPAIAQARHLELCRRVGQQLLGHAVLDLDLLGVLGRRAQRHRDVAGDQVAGDRDHRGVADRAVGEDRDVGGASADVDQRDAQ